MIPKQNRRIQWYLKRALYKDETEGFTMASEPTYEELKKWVEGRKVELEKINARLQVEIAKKKALLERWRKYEFIVNTSNEFMTLINREYVYEAANDAYCKAWNKTREEILGRTVAELWGDKTFRTYIKMNLDKCFVGETVHYERQIDFSRSEQRVFEVHYYPYYGNKADVSHAVVVTHDISERKKAEQALRERERELERKTMKLEEVNAALKVVLKRREEDKKDLKDKVLLNIHEMIMPYLEKLKKSKLNERQKAFTEILESNLKDISSPFSHTLSSKYLGLTPTELQVANLIRQGINTKGIAELLHVSRRTIETHRDGLRKKLGLKGKKANLRTYLMSFQ
jgi:PAS domain S-box-containing protein